MYLRLIDAPGLHSVELKLPGRLYVGSVPRTERDLDQLLGEGVSAVLTVSKKVPVDLVARRYAERDAWYYYHLRDGRQLQVDDYLLVAGWVEQLLGDGQRVLVHCLAGRNRSCLVAALVLRERYGLSGAEAAERVRGCRPRAFHNEDQLGWLRALPAPQ